MTDPPRCNRVIWVTVRGLRKRIDGYCRLDLGHSGPHKK